MTWDTALAFLLGVLTVLAPFVYGKWYGANQERKKNIRLVCEGWIFCKPPNSPKDMAYWLQPKDYLRIVMTDHGDD